MPKSFTSTIITTLAAAAFTSSAMAASANPKTNAAEFIEAPQYSISSDVHSVAAADFNGDGRADLVVSTSNDTAAVLLAKAGGTFSAPKFYACGVSPYAVVVGDLNGDGKLDFVVVNFDAGTVSVLLGNGDGTFLPAISSTAGSGANGLAIGDFNGDGKPDLAVVNETSATVSILIGKG